MLRSCCETSEFAETAVRKARRTRARIFDVPLIDSMLVLRKKNALRDRQNEFHANVSTTLTTTSSRAEATQSPHYAEFRQQAQRIRLEQKIA